MAGRRTTKKSKSVRHVAKRSSKKTSKPKVKATAAKKTTKPSAPAKSKAPVAGALTVYNMNGNSEGTMALDTMFYESPVNQDVIYQAVLAYQAGEREGTAATKTRGEVSGGGKKPWKQKHTGRARHASIRSPLWRGGGTVFGPHPRDYSYQIPMQLRRLAVVEGVKDKVENGKLWILKELTINTPKTKLVAEVLETFKLNKPLVLVEKKSQELLMASRNIPGLSVKTAEEVNALDVVSHKECVMTKSAYSGLVKRLKS
jgi:large subunit ribosomal protein L4